MDQSLHKHTPISVSTNSDSTEALLRAVESIHKDVIAILTNAGIGVDIGRNIKRAESYSADSTDSRKS